MLLLLASCAPALRPPPPGGAAAPDDPVALAGEVRALLRQVEHEPSSSAREPLVAAAVSAAERCDRVAPATPGCDYALALALGVQAREHPSSALSVLATIVERLTRAARADPRLDRAGPHRVLALVRLRAPGWPLGPGDPESGLEEARRAVALAPDHSPNLLALAEALEATGAPEAAQGAAARALALARAAEATGEPDAGDWAREAVRRLAGAEARGR
jgi:hypothetical protein